MASQVGPGQMDGDITALQRRRIRNGLRTVRVPLHFDDVGLGMPAGRAADKEDDLISVMGQALGECLANQAGSAAHQ